MRGLRRALPLVAYLAQETEINAVSFSGLFTHLSSVQAQHPDVSLDLASIRALLSSQLIVVSVLRQWAACTPHVFSFRWLRLLTRRGF